MGSTSCFRRDNVDEKEDREQDRDEVETPSWIEMGGDSGSKEKAKGQRADKAPRP